MSSRTDVALGEVRARVEARLAELVDALVDTTPRMDEAIRYVVLGGGKRLRAALCIWTHDMLGGDDVEGAVDAGAAIECLHAYTLVHDDLPCMDDDDLRRGRPSCHRQYDEATAVLVGDALQALCFEILATLGPRRGVADNRVVMLTRTIAEAAGTKGLITGQALDLYPDAAGATEVDVERIHRHKTAALIAASMSAGAILAGSDQATLDRVRDSGMDAGLAFQVIDDVLDVEMDDKTLGKTPGKDAKAGKLTYPSVIGVGAARQRARDLVDRARESLGASGSQLGDLLGILVERTR